MKPSKELILATIRELAGTNGTVPGQRLFEQHTGITRPVWRGVYWATWSDALAEAGFAANRPPDRLDGAAFMPQLAQAIRHYGRLPTDTELRLYGRRNPEFPSHSTINKHFGGRQALYSLLHTFCLDHDGYDDVLSICEPIAGSVTPPHPKVGEGFVYLVKSGQHYKIGKSDNLERRMKEIRIALPEAAVLVHVIRTDDPDGIEAYWHRRFASQRANGEWFSLAAKDVSAFRRRKFQ